MEQTSNRGQSTTQMDAWTWIILAGLLVLSFFVCLGALALTSMNEQNKAGAPVNAPTVPTAPR